MASVQDSQSSAGARRQFQSEIASYIAQSHWDFNSHAAFKEAFRGVPVEIIDQQAQLRRTVSCDSLPIATRTLDRIQSHGLKRPATTAQKRPELRDVFESSSANLRRLQNAMEEYEASVPDNLRTKVDFTSMHSWAEVMQAVEDVRTEHNSVKGFRERFRKGCSKVLTKHATAVLVWIEILPSQNEFFSPICGGLKLIFGAAAKLDEIQGDICAALEQIPSVLDQANTTLEMFEQHGLQEDSPLFFYGNKLMSSILVTLNCIVDELTEKAWKRAGNSLLKQNTYSQSLSNALGTMTSNALQLAQAAKQSSTAAILDTRKKVENLSSEVERLRDENKALNVYAVHKASLNLAGAAEDRSLTKGMNGKLDSILDKARSLESVALQKKVVEDTLKDLLPRFLESAERIDIRTGRASEIGEEGRRAEIQNSAKYRQQLTEEIRASILRYDEAVVELDTQKRRFSGALDARAQDRAVALLKTTRLQNFMSKPHSTVLFANANCNLDSSPTAYVSAALASSIKQPSQNTGTESQNVFALTFFCARHTDKYDPLAGPCGLMRSFVSQLLSYYVPPLPYLRMAQRADCEDVEDLSRLFVSIVDTLPRNVVLFCIIDSVTAYETRTAYEEGVGSLIKSLVQLAQQKDRGPVLKLWFSAASGSRNLRGLLADDEVIKLSPDPPRTSGLSRSGLSVL